MKLLRWMLLGIWLGLFTTSFGQEAVQVDSSYIQLRAFDEEKRQAYLEDEAYQYDKLRKQKTQDGFWDRFWKRIFELRQVM